MSLTQNVLIADDSKPTRGAIRFLIEKQKGMTVCGEAADGLEAVEKAKELKPDLVLLDLAMPRLNGAAAASVLKRTVPSALIVLFTMYEEAIDLVAPGVGVDLVLSKPDGLRHLMQFAQDLLNARESDRTLLSPIRDVEPTPHFHICWAGKEAPDWESFPTRAAAEERAKELVRANETYVVVERDQRCPRCTEVLKRSSFS